MVRTIDITNTWNLVGSVETYTLRTYHDDLCLTEKLQECESNSPNKPPFAINYLQYYNSHEPVTSWIIRHLFAYTFNGKHPFFESFAFAIGIITTFLPSLSNCSFFQFA